MTTEIANLSIFCTTKCNVKCPLCACQWLMDARPDYSMTLESLDKFIARCETLDVHFGWAWFTGGECTQWPDLIGGIERLAASPSFGKLRIKTNGHAVDRLEPVLPLLSQVLFTAYKSNVKKLAGFVGKDKFSFMAEPHRQLPDEPIAGTSPAACCCPSPSFFDGRVYCCPGPLQIYPKRGLPLGGDDISCDIEDDFLSWYEILSKIRPLQDICQQCISNNKVYRAQKHTEEPLFDLCGIPGCRGRKDI